MEVVHASVEDDAPPTTNRRSSSQEEIGGTSPTVPDGRSCWREVCPMVSRITCPRGGVDTRRTALRRGQNEQRECGEATTRTELIPRNHCPRQRSGVVTAANIASSQIGPDIFVTCLGQTPLTPCMVLDIWVLDIWEGHRRPGSP